MMSQPLIEFNLVRAKFEIGDGEKVVEIWNEILNLCQKIPQNLDIEEWLLRAHNLIKSESLGEWKFKSRQNVFISAFQGNGCNCSCGSQLLLCLAEWKGKLGEIGEAKWRNHTTLAHLRPSSNQVVILETTNLNPHWKNIETVEKCHFQTEFRPQYIFMHSVGELGNNGYSLQKRQIALSCFNSFPKEFWLEAGGDLGLISWMWATKSEKFRQLAFSLVQSAMQLEIPKAGPLLIRKMWTLFLLLCTPGSATQQLVYQQLLPLTSALNEQCPVPDK